MSSENEDPRSADKGSEKFDVVLVKPKISYSRDILLSLSNLDICKTLPSGFDESLLSEFEDASPCIPDRQKIPGGAPLHGFRRNEYGSSPPTRRDFGYSRNTSGKWENRSSGRSDRDSDSQSDKDSDSGKRYGNQARRSWQTPEHDGLLGSGSFPRSGFAGGISASKVQTNEHNQPTKSIEPYHPPKPYKALPHSRRDTDSFNDETFGSAELTSEDKAEEEGKRRASFELMRKEQQKALQEKQKGDLDKHKAGGTPNLCEISDESNEKKRFIRSNELGAPSATTISSNDTERSSLGSNSPATRPLIPPGFKNNILDKTSGLKSLIHPPSSEAEKPETGEKLMDNESALVQNDNHEGLEWQLSQEISLLDVQPSEKTQQAPLLDDRKKLSLPAGLPVPVKIVSMEDELHLTSAHLNSHGILNDENIFEVKSAVLEDKSAGDSNRSNSTSILAKIFGSTLPVNSGDFDSVEHQVSNPDDAWSPKSVNASKFARWFSEEESKSPDDITSGRSNDLLSLLASSDKVKYQVFDTEAAEHLAHQHSYQTLEQANNIRHALPSASIALSTHKSIETKEAVPSVLTCEDLEQSILSEYGVKTLQPQLKSQSGISTKLEEPIAEVDNDASVHLLSLLQKGKEQTRTNPGYGVDINLADKLLVSSENDMVKSVNEHIGEENTKYMPNLGKTLTLETLFGTAFMNELQSAEAPVSIKRGSSGSARDGLPLEFTNNNISPPLIDRIGLQKPSLEYSGMTSDNRQRTKLSHAEHWLGSDDPHIEIASKKHHIRPVTRLGGFEGVLDAQLSEENIMTISDPRYHRMSTDIPTDNSSRNVKLASNAPISIADKLAAISSAVKDERVMACPESVPFTRPYEQVESAITYHNLQHQHSSQFQPPQITQLRPSYHQMQANPQMKFLDPEPMFNYDSPANHQFSSNDISSFHHPNVPSYQSRLHQMQMPGNHLNIIPNIPRGGPSSHQGNQPTGLTHEMNQMQGFPIGARQPQPNRGVPMPGPNMNSGSNPPEAFQRLIEMELRAKSKQIHPFGRGPDPGIYGMR